MQVKYEDILRIYEDEVRKNTKNKKKIYRFERYKIENLIEICDILESNSYKYMKYNIFLIRNPKYRVVMSLSIKDKIINHYVTRFILMPKLERYLDMRNVATREGMGRDYAIRLVKKYIEHFKRYDKCYVLKMDISKYFYSIDHQVLKEMLKFKLNDEEYEIITSIIDSTDYAYINDTIKILKENELSKIKIRRSEVEEIPLYLKGKGLPIGNMSSQFLSVFFLNELDHKIVHEYHLKHYVRYMDDMLIFCEDKERLKEVKVLIENELEEKYRLKVNKKKSFIVNIKNGVNFCGYKFRIIDNKTVVNVSKDTFKRVKKRIKEVSYLYRNKVISDRKAFSSINTYSNGFKFGSKRKVNRLIEKYFWGKFED